MRRGTRILVAALALAVLAAGLALARDPWLLVRAEFARERIASGLQRAQVEVAGHRWVYAYDDTAQAGAPVVVMLHGFTGSKENWYPLARRLRGEYRLLIPDLPGWGESQRIAGADYGYVAQAARVAAFIARIAPEHGGGNGGVVLLGHSMGGGIAALVAARHPHAVARLGLLDAAGVRFADNAFGKAVLAGRNPFAVTDAASLQRYLDTVFGDAAAKPWVPWPASAGLIDKRRADAAFEQSVLDRIGRGRQRFAPGRAAVDIEQPTLLLWCRQDQVIDASAMQVYAQRIPQAFTVLLDGCGHMSLMERPDAVAQAIERLMHEEGRR